MHPANIVMLYYIKSSVNSFNSFYKPINSSFINLLGKWVLFKHSVRSEDCGLDLNLLRKQPHKTRAIKSAGWLNMLS